MATLGHVAVGMAAGRLGLHRDAPKWQRSLAMLLLAGLAAAPDLDIAAFWLGIPYGAEWGHRGAVHSPVFNLLAGGLIYLGGWLLWRWRWQIGVAICVALVSHGLLDIFTDGGYGIALAWPFSNARYFAPWQPIPVAPIGMRFFSPRGLGIAVTELIFFSPLFALALWPKRPAPAAVGDADDEEEDDAPDPAEVNIPIDGTLDLHNFRPKEIKNLVTDYVTECERRGIYELRIVHGKGIGNLRRTVHATLERIPVVASFELAGGDAGAWGATLVTLKRA